MNIRKYNVHKTLVLLIYSIYLILAFSLIYNLNLYNYESWLIKFSYIVISHIFITLACFRSIGIQTMSLTNIFLLLLYIFHLGQILLKGLSQNYIYNFDVSNIIGEDIYVNAVIFSLIAISTFSIGIILGFRKHEEINYSGEINKSIYKLAINMGLIILLITFPIDVYYTILKLKASSSGGYLDVLNVENSGIMSQFARFHLIGISLLIMGFSYSKKKSNYIYIMYMIYLLISMLSGSRIYQIISIIVTTYILLKSTNKKISIKFIIPTLIISFLGLVILNTIADMRGMRIDNIDEVIELFNIKLINNPIFDSIEEFGSTIYTVCLTLIKVPLQINFSKGKQFIEGFVSIVPNINGIFTEINYNANFVNLLDTDAIGGSYIAELYYSFGYIGIIASLIIGFIWIKLDQKLDYYIHNKRYVHVSYFIMIMFSSFVWVRGSYTAILRNSIWGVIFICIIYNLLLLLKRKSRIRLYKKNLDVNKYNDKSM